MADITETPDGRRFEFKWSHGSIESDVSVTLIGQSLSLARGSIAGYEWGENPTGRQLSLAQGTPVVSTIQNVNISSQILSTGQGVPTVYDFIASSRLLTLAQGTISVLGDINGAPIGIQLVLNQSPNIQSDLSYTTVGQALALAIGTVSTNTTNETIVTIAGQALSLAQGAVSVGALTVDVTPSSRLLVLTQSPNVVEQWLLNLIGQDFRFSQGTPTVSITIDPGTTVNIVGQSLVLNRGTPLSVVADFVPIGRQLTFTIPLAVTRVDRTEEIDGRVLTLNQGTPTVVSIPGVTNIAGIPLVLSQGIPVVTTIVSNNIVGQALSLAQGSVSVVITIDATVSIVGQQLTLNQGSLGLSHDVFIYGQDLFFNQGSLLVQDATNVTVTVLGQQLTLSQGSLQYELTTDEEILGLDLILNQGIVSVITTSSETNIQGQGIELILNQGSICIVIYGTLDIGLPSIYDPELDFVTVYSDEGAFSPTYTPEHCD